MQEDTQQFDTQTTRSRRYIQPMSSQGVIGLFKNSMSVACRFFALK